MGRGRWGGCPPSPLRPAQPPAFALVGFREHLGQTAAQAFRKVLLQVGIGLHVAVPGRTFARPGQAAQEAGIILLAADRVRVQAAFHKVNGVALQVLRASLSIDADTGRRRSNWRTFFSTLEKESGVPAKDFMRNRALVSVLAARMIAVTEEQRAYEEAKKDAERKAKTKGRHRDA